jgi:hypothetical protein
VIEVRPRHSRRTPLQTTSRNLNPQEREKLRNHVVNLRQGRFSTDGDFITTRQDVDRIFAVELPAALAEAKAGGRKLRLLFYAHGGLVSESSGISGALDQIEFWKANQIYPVFFIWETGILEVLADLLRKLLIGQRGFTDILGGATAKVLESLARPGGVRAWGNMKLSAQAASAPGGGAHIVADLAGRFIAAHAADVKIHACGHSAGAIFHAFFLPALAATGAKVSSLHLLAPAVNIPTFKSMLAPLAGQGIGAMTMLTMHREFERADTAGPYPKSLLYFVHHSFEDPDETPILGLEENVTADAEASALFGSAPHEIVYSVTALGASKRASTRAVHHGDFDNDAPTMNCVCRRILGVDDGVAISDFPQARGRSFDPLEMLNQELIVARQATVASGGGPVGAGRGFGAANITGGAGTAPAPGNITSAAAPGGRRTALCVGVDAYPPPNTLQGCVNDSRDWEALFQSMQYTVSTLRDGEATRAGITNALARHVSEMKPGDIFLLQYAGHGTQFPDDTGDEPDNKDEALCPVDMMTNGFIRDDEIRLILNRVPQGALAVAFIDCCHSGSIVRMIRELGARDLDSSSRPRAIDPTPEMIEVHRRTRRGGRAVATPFRRDILFAACRDDQVAFESAGHGDFTKAVVPIVRGSSGRGLTNIAIQKLIQEAFGAGARQNPMLDCDTAAESRQFLQL